MYDEPFVENKAAGARVRGRTPDSELGFGFSVRVLTLF
jgi:hypothetical protein